MANSLKFLVFLILGLIGCTNEVEPESVDDMRGMRRLITEAATGGWAVNGDITPLSPFAGNPFTGVLAQKGVGMQVNFQESKEHTIQFDFNNDADDNASVHVVRAVATITWNVEGGFVTRRVSCAQGMSITGVAQGAKVVIQDASIVPIGQTMRKYQVSAQIAPGQRASIQQPPFLEGNEISLALNSNTTFAIPQGIGAISLYLAVASQAIGTALAPGMLLVQHSGVGGISLKAYDPALQNGWVPLSPGTTSVRIDSSAGAPNTFITPILGIDG